MHLNASAAFFFNGPASLNAFPLNVLNNAEIQRQKEEMKTVMVCESLAAGCWLSTGMKYTHQAE